MKAPQKVQAGAIPDGWPGQSMPWMDFPSSPDHLPQPSVLFWGWSEPGLQLCLQGTPGPSRIVWAACFIESMSICLTHSAVKQYKNVRVWSSRVLLQGHASRQAAHVLKTPNSPKALNKALLYKSEGRGPG